MNIAKRCPTHAHSGRHVAQPAFHKHNIRRINSDIRSCSDGNADIRTGQRRSIVDSVTDHGNLAFFLELSDHTLLTVREDSGNDLVDACLFSDGLCSALVIAGQHDYMDSHVLELPDCLWTVFLDHIRNSDDAHKLLILRKE